MKFLPREEKFFELMNSLTKIINEASKVLLEGLQKGGSDLEPMEARIQKFEQDCDEIMHEVFRRLNSTFITPLDPEDIHNLSTHLDDVMDGIEEATHCIVSYDIGPIPPDIIEISALLVKCVAELQTAVAAMDGSNSEVVIHCIEINRIEEQVDKIVRRAIVDLFRNEKDAIRVIKLKEIYDVLEWTVDSCEDVSDVLQGVVVKNS